MLSTRRPGRDVLGGRLLPPERRGARTSVVVPVLPPDRLYPYPLPFDEGNCHDACEHSLLVTSYQVPMRRIGLAVVLAISVLAPLAADAQSPSTTPRIGWLAPFSSSDPQVQGGVDLFRQTLRELGHVEGQSVAIEYRWAEGKPERLPALATELVRLKVDVIVTTGGVPSAQAAQRAT